MNVQTSPDQTGQQDSAERDAWMRGFFAGHDQGNAAGAATEALVRQLQAHAWREGYGTGHATGIDEARVDIGLTITDLAARFAEVDESFANFARVTREQHIANRVAEMEQHAAKLHAATGTKPWVGLDNGGVLPSADWDMTA